MNVTRLSCLTRYVWNAGFPTAYLCFRLSRDARPLIMQHFVFCTLLMGCQDSAQERHCAVYHYVISVEAGGIDVQVSFPAHLHPALLLLKPMTNSPWLFPVFFLTPAAGRHDWVELWVLQVTTTAWRMGFSHSMSWQSDSQSREWAALILLLFIPPKHSSISKGVLWCFRWAQKSEAAMTCRYLWQSFTGGVALIQSIR